MLGMRSRCVDQEKRTCCLDCQSQLGQLYSILMEYTAVVHIRVRPLAQADAVDAMTQSDSHLFYHAMFKKLS